MKKKELKVLNFFEIVNIGRIIESEMLICQNTEKNEFTIYVDEDMFKKLDEDIYYRQFPDGKDFKPSDDTIVINFEYLVIFVKKKKKEE